MSLNCIGLSHYEYTREDCGSRLLRNDFVARSDDLGLVEKAQGCRWLKRQLAGRRKQVPLVD
jgi:hypothetical protein